MPTYTFDYITVDGPGRESFTLDQDRPVGVQVRRVLAELRQRDVVLLGGRDDVLSIDWNGAPVDEKLSPEALGLTAHRPIELRMRPRYVAPVTVRAAARSGSPRTLFMPLSVLSGLLLGGVGGAIAFTILALLPMSADASQDRDAIAIVFLLGLVGLPTVVAQHGPRRRIVLGLVALIVGTALTASIAVALSAASADANRPFLVQRLVLFVSVGALGAVTLALAAPQVGSFGALLEVCALGALSGATGALLTSAESLGVGSAIAWPLFGSLLGAVAVWPRLRRAFALCELLPPRRGIAAPFRMRSYPLATNGTLDLDDGASVSENAGEVLWAAQSAISIDGQLPTAAAITVNGDRVQVGGRVYHYRELP